MNFQEFQELEEVYEVENIKVNGIQIWPVLRIYIASQLVFEQDRSVRLNKGVLFSGLKNFFYGILYFFGKTRFLFFSSADQRKKIGEKYIDRADFVASLLPETLIVELPSNGKHFPKSLCPGNRLMSKFPFYFFRLLISYIMPAPTLEREDILLEILGKSGVHIQYKKLMKRFLAERLLMSRLISWKKLRGFFLITPYTNSGYVYAFRERGLPVFEFQHGTISSSHYAYNINKNYDRFFYPSKLLTFGRREADVFHENNFYIDKTDVIPVGSHVIDSVLKQKPSDKPFTVISEKYEKMVAFAAQDALEKQFIPFLKSAAELDKTIGYVLIPRFRDLNYYAGFEFPENVVYMPWLSTYEIIYMCDVHSTINSTTAVEAPSLGTVNVLANVENRAKLYFENFIDSRVCIYADTPEDFVMKIKSLKPLSKVEIVTLNRHLLEPGFGMNIQQVLKDLIS